MRVDYVAKKHLVTPSTAPRSARRYTYVVDDVASIEALCGG